jgi:hypothetical protein
MFRFLVLVNAEAMNHAATKSTSNPPTNRIGHWRQRLGFSHAALTNRVTRMTVERHLGETALANRANTLPRAMRFGESLCPGNLLRQIGILATFRTLP